MASNKGTPVRLATVRHVSSKGTPVCLASSKARPVCIAVSQGKPMCIATTMHVTSKYRPECTASSKGRSMCTTVSPLQAAKADQYALQMVGLDQCVLQVARADPCKQCRGQENRSRRVQELEGQLQEVRNHYHHKLRTLEQQLQVQASLQRTTAIPHGAHCSLSVWATLTISWHLQQ